MDIRGREVWFCVSMLSMGACTDPNEEVASPSLAVTERASSSAESDGAVPSPVSRVPRPASSDAAGPTDHFEVLSEVQQEGVRTYCSHLMELTAPDQPKDTKICASGMAQEILKLEDEEEHSGTRLIEEMARCAQGVQTVEDIRNCRPD